MNKLSKHTSRKRSYLLFSPVCAAVLSAICTLSPSMANATCTGLNTANINCTGTDSGNITSNFSGQTAVTVENWNLNGGHLYVRDSGANNILSFTGNELHITNGSGNSAALFLETTTGGGSIDQTLNNSSIQVTEANTHGISTYANTSGIATANINNVDINMAAGPGSDSYGIIIQGVDGAVLNSVDSNIITTNMGPAVFLLSNKDVTATLRGGTITSSGNDSHGIFAYGGATGAITIQNGNNITTSGSTAYGIFAQTMGTGNITLENSADISTNGVSSHGMYANTVTGNVDITNDGNLNIHGVSVGSKGIYVKTAHDSTVDITNNGTIKHDASSSFQYGMEVVGGDNTHTTITNNGVVDGSSFGIVAWNSGAAHTGGQSTINIGSQGVVNAFYGITADMSDSNTINIANGGLLNAKNNAIQLRSYGAATPVDTVNNSGTITSGRDKILGTTFTTSGASIAFNNKTDGQMTGVMTASNADVAINNEGVWNLRQLEDTHGNGTRDLLSVAVTNLGSGNNQIVNSGTLNLLGDTGSATTLNNAGEYSTGYAANTMSLAGPAQGQLLGIQTFTNSGIIDLSSNNMAGDVLLISGSTTAGTAGNGVYVANGGQLKIDTVLNEGGANSQSDMLVVDGTRLGNNATTVLINNLGGAGALTVDNGIEVVRVLDSARSEAGVFKLGARSTAGLYEYDLYKGGVDTSVADGNWYLRSLTTPVDPVNPNKPVVPIINPESTVYLRNLNAASTMFMHTLHDRLGEPQFTDAYKTGDSNPSSAWVRIVSNHTDSTGGNGQVDLNTDTNLVHLGADIARWSNNGTDRWNIGLMGAYGQSKIDASPNVLGVTPSGFKRNASGKVDGYSVGGYATWYQNKDKPEGLYVDTWAQYGWYDNKVQGNTKAEESYNSNGWTASVEAGYAMIARDEGKNRQLMFEPQIQVAYNNYSSDDHTDASGTRITDNNANGVITRVGARLYSRSTLNDNGIQPFVEANWWYSDAKNSLAFNGETMSDGTPNSRYELKAGLQGEVAKNWLMWGHAGVQFGSNDFNRYEGMVGIKRMF